MPTSSKDQAFTIPIPVPPTPMRRIDRATFETRLLDLVEDARALDASITSVEDFLTRPGHARSVLHDELGVFPHTNVLFDSDNSNHHLANHLGFQMLVGSQGASCYYSYLGYGDQEVPVYYMIYYGIDDQLHGYIPRGGNAVNPFTDRPFTFNDEDDRVAQLLGFVGFRSMEQAFSDPAVAGMVYEHGRILADATCALRFY